jgi:hypothetical protein
MADLAPKFDKTVFSPFMLRATFLDTLVYFFSRTPMQELRYSVDPEQTKIVIDTTDNKNSGELVQNKPRILVNTGGYMISRMGLTDSLAERNPDAPYVGAIDNRNIVMVRGAGTILVEAAEEGVALMLSDMVSCLFTWNVQAICNTFGFKDFGFPLQVSQPMPAKEDVEKYQVSIHIPWVFESAWSQKEDALRMKEYFAAISITT